MKTTIELLGKIIFDPPIVTGKQEKQAEWKLVGMVEFPGQDHRYYEWFIRKRYGIEDFTKPIRKPHVTFVNDGVNEMNLPESEARLKWEAFKAKYENKRISLILDLDVRTNAQYWWLNVINRDELHSMREELGLCTRPFWGLHMTVATSNERSIKQSTYALEQVIKVFGVNGL